MTIPKIYKAPITLGFTPFVGDLICGTVNGVDVNGEWTWTENGGVVKLKRVDDPDTTICTVRFLAGRAAVVVQSASAPTTDYELHLYRYVPAGIVKIPQEYVEGLEAIDGYGIIINSSTPNSTKKFKITVDDTGTISATEVIT